MNAIKKFSKLFVFIAAGKEIISNNMNLGMDVQARLGPKKLNATE